MSLSRGFKNKLANLFTLLYNEVINFKEVRQMSIIKNDIPILEYDNCEHAVINPDHEDVSVKLPECAVFAFLGETVDNYAMAAGAEEAGEFVSITKRYPIYVTHYRGKDICLCQAPVGAAPAVQILDWLIGHGVKKVVATGSCGALVDLPENTFLVPTKALRDEGTSYHYLPPARFVELKGDVLKAIEKVLTEKGLPYTECTTWSTDGFFRETTEMVEYRKSEGCSAVEMECAALAACAKFRGAEFGQLLYTADSLANVHEYDERDWGAASLEKALMLCLDIAWEM